MPPRPSIAEDSITEAFLKGSGPGGQKINKTSSAVQLKHLATGLVVKCQETRSRTQNRKIARRILAERIEEIELGSESRTQVKAAVKIRKKASKDKKARRKYKKLAEGQEGAGSEVDGADEVIEEEEDEVRVREQGEESALLTHKVAIKQTTGLKDDSRSDSLGSGAAVDKRPASTGNG